MEKDEQKSIKEEIPKKIMKSLIDNYSMKIVIGNLYNKTIDEYDGIQSPLYSLKSECGLPHLTNIIYELKDNLTYNDIKDISNFNFNYNYLLLDKKFTNKDNQNICNLFPSYKPKEEKSNNKNKKKLKPKKDNNIIINKSNINLEPNSSLLKMKMYIVQN